MLSGIQSDRYTIADMREGVLEELELCEAIFADELTVAVHTDNAQPGEEEEEEEELQSSGATLTLALRPNTCDDESALFVKLTLQLTLGPQYPDEPPSVSIPNAKGLDDAQLASLIAALAETAADSPGEPVILMLVERAKDFLDDNNAPPLECSICLEPLGSSSNESAGLLRLDCFHCFHPICCARWRLSVLAAAEAKRAANPHAAGANTPPLWTCTTCRAPLGELARAAVEGAIELETREERLAAEHAQSVAAHASAQVDGSDKQIADAAKELRRAELALDAERERRRALQEREAAFERELSGTATWRTASVEEAAAERRRRYEEAQKRGGLIDETWLRRVAAAGTIERAEAIEAVAEAEAMMNANNAAEAAQAKSEAVAKAKVKEAREAKATARAKAREAAKRTPAGSYAQPLPADEANATATAAVLLPRSGTTEADAAARAAHAALAKAKGNHQGGVRGGGRGIGGGRGGGKSASRGERGNGRARSRGRGKRGGRTHGQSGSGDQGGEMTTPRS